MISEEQAIKKYRKQLALSTGNNREFERLKKFEPHKFRQAITSIRINSK